MQSTLTPHNPASYATQVEMLDGTHREAERGKLVQARSLLRETLATHAPDWNEFKQLVENLSEQLSITQKATGLSDQVAHLVTADNNTNENNDGEDDGNRISQERPRVTMDAMKESQRIAANLDTLSRVRKVAECMNVIRSSYGTDSIAQSISSSRAFVSAAASNGGTGMFLGELRSITIQASNMGGFNSQLPPPDFVARAKDIACAQTAANDPALKGVDALKPIHEELRAKNTSMFSELQTLLLYGIFGVPQYETKNINSVGGPKSFVDNVSSAGSIFSHSKSISGIGISPYLRPRLPLSKNGLTNSLPRIQSNIQQPSSSLSQASTHIPAGFSELPSVVQDTLPQIVQAFDILCSNDSDNETSASCRTLEKAARQKAYSVVEHAIKLETKAFFPINTSTATQTDIFSPSGDGTSNMQKFAAAIISRISFHFLAILQRSEQLAKQQNNVVPAVAEIRRQFVAAFLFVVDMLLGQSKQKKRVHQSHASGLNNKKKKNSFHKDFKIHDENTSIAEFWAASPVASILQSYTLNIYNLELMYSVLEAFGREYECLFAASASTPRKKKTPNLTGPLSPLSYYAHVNRLIEMLIGNLKFDLKIHVKAVLGNRAGSLLQPPTLARRSSQNELNLNNTVTVAPSPTMEAIANAVAVCIRIALAIPTAAALIGDAISIDVLNTLNIRAHEALNLATKWTDAGKLNRNLNFNVNRNSGHSESDFEGNTVLNNAIASLTPPKTSGYSGIYRSPSLQQQLQYQASREEVTKFYARVRSAFYEKNTSPTLLTINEWKAIIRLIHGLNSLIESIEKWCSDVNVCEKRGSNAPFVPRWSSGLSGNGNGNGNIANPPNALDALRSGVLGKNKDVQKPENNNNIDTADVNANCNVDNTPCVSTVAAVLKPIEEAVRELQDDVVTPTVNLMKNEVMLRCYWLSTKALEEISDFCDGRRREPIEDDINVNMNKLAPAKEKRPTIGKSPSSTTCRIYEFDEYGDRIPQSEAVGVGKKDTDLTVAENRMVRLAKYSSGELRERFVVSKNGLSSTQQEDVLSGIDTALAAGIGGIRKKHKHRAVAVACRILLQTLVTEDERLAGECTAEQCRALMYSTGMV